MNPSCERSVYWPDERSFWVETWIAADRSRQPITAWACSLRCLIVVLAALETGDRGRVDIRWGA